MPILFGGIWGCSHLPNLGESRELNVVNFTDSEFQFTVRVERDENQLFETRDLLAENENTYYGDIVQEPGLYTLLIDVEGASGEDSWRVSDPARWLSMKQ